MLEAVDQITNFYLGTLDNMNVEHMAKITQMNTDKEFCYGAHDFVSRHLPHAPSDSIFQYVYSHEGKHIFCMNLPI